MLNRIKKIKHKFYLILSAVILVLSTVSAVGFFTTKQVNSNFIHFQSIDEAAFEATDVEAVNMIQDCNQATDELARMSVNLSDQIRFFKLQ
ncbi:hypothetical protein [Vibrio harveyi]|uniref:hypothetical protein n=1 Tax=Vibrio harveyi TaxID=669 RepID=UPI003735FF20|nr:hypothetical protein [Vibrio harveyi]